MLKRNGKVYTQIVKNCSVAQILPIIKGNIDSDAVIYTDSFKTYDGLVNSDIRNIIELNMAKMNLQMDEIISMELRIFGDCARCV